MKRWLTFLAIAAAPVLASGETPGVATERPAEGRYVEVDDVFLVPYEATIPGTDVSFWMEPIPGDKTLAPYWIGRTEVTWAEYRQYMNLCAIFERFNDAGVRQVTDANRVDAITAPSKLYDASFTFGSGDKPELPAVSMTQYAAKQYTKWLSLLTGSVYRLPSEAEWEHACRADGAEPSDPDAVAWHEDNSDFETHAVARKEPNAWGLYDMLGNSSEWVLDAPDAELEDADGPRGEPPVAWPTKLFPRLLKGGSAFLAADEATCDARRDSDDDTWRDYDPNTPKSPWWFANDDAQDVGFRVLRPYQATSDAMRLRYWDADIPRIQKVADFRIDEEGRGERGLVDPGLPAAIKQYGR
ncbi:Formylglycine-generating sulfatase enzyme [Botrimarina colliarenosi]|uniref:Formylglycine-generating sulfatase enzyme n=1 Tax=Botrimarina colliarenosi TaxID=2528001 RepID=A0A5C5ZZ79_9BACT|nr:SUMF1/EgtB/PvdO family nonheme iron enzyme [Botrimarina colliarenosi]TWT92882.1 Formylglycine-generating sulfatase enzyme [Botrimarina colliarenosi]